MTKAVERATAGPSATRLSTPVERCVEARESAANLANRPAGHAEKSSLKRRPARWYARGLPGVERRRVGTSVERQTELTAETLWDDVSARLREALNDTTYSTWFGEVDGAALDDDIFTVAVPNDTLHLTSGACDAAGNGELRFDGAAVGRADGPVSSGI